MFKSEEKAKQEQKSAQQVQPSQAGKDAQQEAQQPSRVAASSQKSEEETSYGKGEAQVDKSASDRLDPNVNVADPVKAPYVPVPEEGEPTEADFAEAARKKQEHYDQEKGEEDLGETPPVAQPLNYDVEATRVQLSPEAQRQVTSSTQAQQKK